jgi:hypothetical protein
MALSLSICACFYCDVHKAGTVRWLCCRVTKRANEKALFIPVLCLLTEQILVNVDTFISINARFDHIPVL